MSATCPTCSGYGWWVDHEDECYQTGDCGCSGVQVECRDCAGTGKRETVADPVADRDTLIARALGAVMCPPNHGGDGIFADGSRCYVCMARYLAAALSEQEKELAAARGLKARTANLIVLFEGFVHGDTQIGEGQILRAINDYMTDQPITLPNNERALRAEADLAAVRGRVQTLEAALSYIATEYECECETPGTSNDCPSCYAAAAVSTGKEPE